MKENSFLLAFTIPFWMLFFGHLSAQAQHKRDSILLNENAIQRPLTLHKHQVRITTGYDFYIVSSKFNAEGNKISLNDEGRSLSRNNIPFLLQYGITNFLEAGISIAYTSQVLRESPLFIFSSLDTAVLTSSFTHTQGTQDIMIHLNGRIPFSSERIDWLVSGSIGMGNSKSSSPQPDHSVKYSSDGYRQIQYQNLDKWGYGTLSYQLGTWIRYKWDRGSLNTSIEYRGINESIGDIRWDYRLLNDDQFIYQQVPYQRMGPQEWKGFIRGEFLLFPWFDIMLGVHGYSTVGGWTEKTGKRVALPDQLEINLVPGYEILVTSRLWIRQFVSLPIAGKNTFANTGFETRLIYNVFIK